MAVTIRPDGTFGYFPEQKICDINVYRSLSVPTKLLAIFNNSNKKKCDFNVWWSPSVPTELLTIFQNKKVILLYGGRYPIACLQAEFAFFVTVITPEKSRRVTSNNES